MLYKCPACSAPISVARIFFKTIPECEACGQKVVFGSITSYLAFGLSMPITAVLLDAGLKAMGIVGFKANLIIIIVAIIVGAAVLLTLSPVKPYVKKMR